MDTFSCPDCGAHLKLALVKFSQADSAVSEPLPEPPKPAMDEHVGKGRPLTSSRPDVVAYSESVADHNRKLAKRLVEFIRAEPWYDPKPSPEIFDRYQDWCERTYGNADVATTKNRISKVLVDIVGCTWHKTGKGRMYRLPDDLRPPAPPKDKEIPVGPSPSSGPPPAPLTVVPADNVVQIRPADPVDEAAADRCPAWMVERGAPSMQCALPAEHIDAGADHEAEGWWWDGAGLHGRLTAAGQDSAPPFVDFPETTEGGEVSVTEDGVFDAAGERLPGDDEPAAVTEGWFAEGGESVPDTNSLPAGPVLEKGPDGVYRLPADNLAVAAAPVVAAAPLVELPVPATPDDFVYGVAEGDFPAEVAEHVAEGTVGGYSVAAPTTEPLTPVLAEALADERRETVERQPVPDLTTLAAPAEPEPVDVTEVLPEGARLCSKMLTDEQIGWPLRRIASIFDDFAGGQGLVRLGSLADIELRKIMGKNYATAMVCPAGNLPDDQPEVELVDRAADETWAPELAVEEPAAALAPAGVPVPHVVPVSVEQAGLPFGQLEDLFTSGLPEGMSWTGAPIELTKDPGTGSPAIVGSVVDSRPAVGPDVSGEDLQGLVGGDAAAAALAAYRAASAGLAVPDHVLDEGDWG